MEAQYMLNFILCDDNPNAVSRLSKMLESIIIQNKLDGHITFTTNDPFSLLDYIKQNLVHVVILDIDLKESMSGLEVAEQIRKQNKNIYIIFITGHLEYGLMAYKYKTFDYIPKPVTQERLEDTINRLYDDITTHNIKYLRLNNNKTIIPENSINYIQKDGMKLVFHADTRDYEVYNSFNKVTVSLPKQFIRCHKSYIVNMSKISNIDMRENTITFDNSDSCYIGPKYKNKFMEVFNNGIFTNNLDSPNNIK